MYELNVYHVPYSSQLTEGVTRSSEFDQRLITYEKLYYNRPYNNVIQEKLYKRKTVHKYQDLTLTRRRSGVLPEIIKSILINEDMVFLRSKSILKKIFSIKKLIALA